MNPLAKFELSDILKIREKLILLIAMREYCAEVGCEYDMNCRKCKYYNPGCNKKDCPELRSMYDLDCPLCELKIYTSCKKCPWVIFEGKICSAIEYSNCNPSALIRCTNWLQLLDGYILDLYGY